MDIPEHADQRKSALASADEAERLTRSESPLQWAYMTHALVHGLVYVGDQIARVAQTLIERQA